MFKKRNLIFLSLLLVVFLFTSCLSFLTKPPVTEGILKGKIIVPEGIIKAKDLTGQALPNATINIIDPLTGAILATTTTDANGNYQVLVPAGGPYLLQAIKDGIKVQQITPSVEVGIEYDLGTADCSTTAVALIVQAMLEDDSYPDDPADINLANIEADWYFTGVLNSVCDVLGTGVDPAVSALVQQAVEDFLHPPTPTPHPTPTVPVAAPVIATVSKIADKEENPTVIVTGTNFKYPGGVAADLTVKVTLGERKKTPAALELGTVTFVSTTEITVAFTGRAAAGDVITIQANASAFDPAGVSASNTLTINVPEPTVINIAAIPGVTAPVKNIIPVATITATDQYTGTVIWSPTHSPFWAATTYTATITLNAKAGYTLTSVAANFFTVAGAAPVTNTIDTGVVTAVFPETAAIAIGDNYQGGKIAYILQSEDPGYNVSVQHGLIAAAADINTTYTDTWNVNLHNPFYRWSTGQITTVNTTDYAYQSISTSTAIGQGLINTTAILAIYPASTYPNTAAAVAQAYTDGIYNDWFLPSKDELNKLYLNQGTIGGFAGGNAYYWSSSQYNTEASRAWSQNFTSGAQEGNDDKLGARLVRAVRAF